MLKQFQIGIGENGYYITNSTLRIPEEDFVHLIGDVVTMFITSEGLMNEYEIAVNPDAQKRMSVKEKTILDLFVKKHNELVRIIEGSR